MTKFEEELNKIEVEVQTPLDKYIVEKAASDESLYAQHYEAVLEKFKDWHSDEDYQRAKRMVEHVQVENEMLKAKLKSQLQQQALPVVPELTQKQADILNDYKNGSGSLASYLSTEIKKGDYDYFARAWLDGYTVEKPQLFYLRDELTGQFLAKDNQFKDKDRYFFWAGADPLTHSIGTAWKLTFTQQEIDSMETGSYEQIEVTE
ncbi:hypothetical protein B9W73_01105 [Lactococcus lactis]|uniref:DUF1642 domain-containing protein n=1 Tax=Lactococcus lactis TaxID=1358 RepID=UPI000A1E69F9|nr:DUF1642 domain-containing protein [Lactococcus lactis]OSP88511.1 hypothetical protein B9W73_01105 [Lactococcus lactis]